MAEEWNPFYRVKPTEAELNEVLNKLSEQIEKGGSRYRGMTYEQGVEAGIRWVVGDTDEHPYDDE